MRIVMVIVAAFCGGACIVDDEEKDVPEEIRAAEHVCCLTTFPESNEFAACLAPHLPENYCLNVTCGGLVPAFWVCSQSATP